MTRNPLTVIIIAIIFIAGCKKSDIPPPPGSFHLQPRFDSYSITDYCNRLITIEGENFSPDIKKDSVFFGQEKGIIQSADSTHIIVQYPAGEISGELLVWANGMLA